MSNKIFQIIVFMALGVFLVLTKFFRLSNAMSYASFFSVLLAYLYDRLIWKYCPLEKAPRIAGTYAVDFTSSYNGGSEFQSKIIIRQTLSSITVCEHLTCRAGYCESIAASLVKPSGNGNWRLCYTYVTRQNNLSKDAMHEGTVILDIMDKNTMAGTYFTNRTEQTSGYMKLERIPNSFK